MQGPIELQLQPEGGLHPQHTKDGLHPQHTKDGLHPPHIEQAAPTWWAAPTIMTTWAHLGPPGGGLSLHRAAGAVPGQFGGFVHDCPSPTTTTHPNHPPTTCASLLPMHTCTPKCNGTCVVVIKPEHVYENYHAWHTHRYIADVW
jgi:hypothetical protein